MRAESRGSSSEDGILPRPYYAYQNYRVGIIAVHEPYILDIAAVAKEKT